MARIRFGDPSQEISVPVLNLSRGGMFLSLERSFPPLHSEVEFSVTITKAEAQPSIEGKALVRWVRERAASGHLPGMGLEFTELGNAARDYLDAYVDRASSRR